MEEQKLSYAVFLEICSIPTKEEADKIAEKVKDRFDDVKHEVNVCISEYYLREKKSQ